MSRILMLGGGSSQLAGIRRCKQRGHELIVADIDPAAPGVSMADGFAEASTFDPEGISLAAAEHRVHGILTMGSDQPVLTQAVAAERLGLPAFLDPERALLVTNKKAMKSCLTGHGVPLAPFAIMHEWETRVPGHIQLPAVMKPLDSQGQRGIFYLTEREIPAERIRECLSFSRLHEFIVEEFYPGGEVTLSGWVHDGEIYHYSVTDRVTRHMLPRLGVCFAHRYPSRYSAARGAEIRECADQAVRALGIESGPIYIQLFVGESAVLINEVACRLGGAYEDEFLPLICGVDMLELLLKGSLGQEICTEEVRPRQAESLYLSVPLLFTSPGEIETWEGERELCSRSGVLNLQTLLPVGTEVHSMRNSTQRAAYAILRGQTPAEVNSLVDELFSGLKAISPHGENLLIDAREECRFPDSFSTA